MPYARTALLLAGLTGLFLVIGYAIGGEGGMAIAFVVAAVGNLLAYWNADAMVLSMAGARAIERAEAPGFYGIVEQLAARAGLPMPRVFLIDEDQPNAFATGRDPAHAAVAATTGLLARLTPEETAGVMAHELAHVRNRDTLIMTVAATIAGAIGMLAQFAFFFGGARGNDRAERRDLRPALVASFGPGQTRCRRAGHRKPDRRTQPGHRAPLYRQSAERRGHG